MLKQLPERITFAQQRIINLIKDRKLRQWCINHDLQHSAIYRIGIGEQKPSYKIISSMCHLIPPIEWLFYTDEKLPYEPQLVPKWDYTQKSNFIFQHQLDYKEIAKKYNLTDLAAYNIFVVNRALPSLPLIRACCNETNPINFFINTDEPIIPKKFYPDRGDIINIHNNIVLVLSQKNDIEAKKLITCVPINSNKNDFLLKNTQSKGYIQINEILTYSLASKHQIFYLESVEKSIIESVIFEARKVFD